MQSVYEAIGKNIRQKRKEKNLTQEKLANQMDTSAQYISRIERGKVGPSLEFLYKISSVLNCPIYALLPSAYPVQRSFFSEEIEYQLNNCSAWKKHFLVNYIAWFLQQADPFYHVDEKTDEE